MSFPQRTPLLLDPLLRAERAHCSPDLPTAGQGSWASPCSLPGLQLLICEMDPGTQESGVPSLGSLTPQPFTSGLAWSRPIQSSGREMMRWGVLDNSPV